MNAGTRACCSDQRVAAADAGAGAVGAAGQKYLGNGRRNCPIDLYCSVSNVPESLINKSTHTPIKHGSWNALQKSNVYASHLLQSTRSLI